MKHISAVHLMSPSELRSPVEVLQTDRESLLSRGFVRGGLTGSSVHDHVFFGKHTRSSGSLIHIEREGESDF